VLIRLSKFKIEWKKKSKIIEKKEKENVKESALGFPGRESIGTVRKRCVLAKSGEEATLSTSPRVRGFF